MQLSAKEISSSTELPNGFRSTNFPFARTFFKRFTGIFLTTLKSRISGIEAEAIVLAECMIVSLGGHPARGISIFDCPEQNHTSPTRTLFIVIVVSLADIFIVYGPPASGVVKLY